MIHFDINVLKKELEELENKTLKEGFWEDSKESGVVLKKINSIKNKVIKVHLVNLKCV